MVRASTVVLAAVGCWAIFVAATNGPRPLLLSERNAIEASVREVLRDPDSAQFKMSLKQPNTETFCGWVNARNAFGGYTGFSMFEVRVKSFGKEAVASLENLESESAQHGQREVMQANCRAAGYTQF